MKYWFKVLFTPSCWLQLQSYSPVWDAQLRHLLDSGEKFSNLSPTGCSAKIGKHEVWIENHPYASFTPYQGLKYRPSRATILRAMDHLVKDVLEAAQEQQYNTSSLVDK